MKIDEINTKITELRAEIPTASEQRIIEIRRELLSLGREILKTCSE
jgi:hypothetical protein